MKFRSYGAEIVSNVALGRRQNEPNQRVRFRDFNIPHSAKEAQGRPRPRGMRAGG